MSWPGQMRLQLKVGTKVMQVWNKSDDLRNGSIGTFVGVRGDSLLVSCEVPRQYSGIKFQSKSSIKTWI